jgi:hypothetical protein
MANYISHPPLHRRRLLLIRIAALFFALCAPFFAAPPAGKRPAPAAKPAPARSDAEIESSIRARFAKSKISTDRFEVKVRNGIATIEGRTGVVQRKGVATRLARLGGAREVINNVQLSDAARQRAQANLAKGRKKLEVKRAPSE